MTMALPWSLQKLGGSSVLKDLPFGLTGGTIVGCGLPRIDPSNSIATSQTGFIFFAMHRHELTMVFRQIGTFEMCPCFCNSMLQCGSDCVEK
jgi:hypothetical protein